MILQDARPYVARASGDAALQFVWLSLKDTSGRVVQNCFHALAEGWREERMKRELFALCSRLLFRFIAQKMGDLGGGGITGNQRINPMQRQLREDHLERV